MIRRLFLLTLGIVGIGVLTSQFETTNAASEKKLEVGQQAPVFKGVTLENQKLELNQFKNKLILVDFWATWCPPCRAEIPHLQQAYKEFHDKGLEIISIDVNEPAETIQKFIQSESNQMPWHHIADKGNEISSRYFVSSIPSPFLIDPKGIIIAMGTDLRGESLMKTLAAKIKTLPESKTDDQAE